MSDPRLPAATTIDPSSATDSLALGARLAAPALAQVRSRLAVVSLMFATMGVFFSVIVLGLLTSLSPTAFGRSPFTDSEWAVTLIIVSSLTVFGITRIRRIEPLSFVDISLAYELVMALAFAWLRHGNRWDPPNTMPNGISPVCLVVILFPLMVPAPVRKSLATGFAAATMEIGVIFILAATAGNPLPELFPFIAFCAPNFACVALSAIPLRALARMARDVEKAKEMGSYRLTEKLGEGGMGEVWRAEHRMLARPAAIKLVNVERLAREPEERTQVLRRFEREAQATAALFSQHTIDVFDFGVTPDGVFYYVMELLDGLDLDSLITRYGPMSPERVVHVLSQVCDSLGDAHLSGVIHRDVKPANIYLCRYGHQVDFAKVLDFGLVKLSGDLRGDAAKLTVEGTVAGTPAFIAPEAALGADEVDARADIYAMGCVAYWMLTGQLVFENDSPMQTLIDHVHTDPVPPSQRVETPIPEALEALVLSCLAKEPADRPASAEHLKERLGHIELESAWTPERAERWWDRHLPPREKDRARSMIASAESRTLLPR
jgi:serine/threonine-protein kinase